MTLRDMTISDVERLDEAGEAAGVFHMDEAAFRHFYERTSRALWAYLYRLTRDAGRSDDLLQDAYYRFLRTREAPTDEAHRRNYLYRIATNLVRDDLRRRRGPHVELPADDDALPLRSQDRGAEGVAVKADVGRAMARLSSRERELLWLAYAEGATHREIADTLGLKTSSIKLLLFRARRRMADILRRPAPTPMDKGGA